MDPRPTNTDPARREASLAEPSFDLAAFRTLPADELLRRAREAGFEAPQPDRPELVLAVVGHEVAADATGRAAGILDVRPEGFGFLRSPLRCRAGADDVYLSPNQIHRLRLQSGHEVEGLIRLPRPGERFFAMVRVERVDGIPIDDRAVPLPFRHTTPVLPHTRLALAHEGGPVSLDVIDRLAPLGFGHRVLVRALRDGPRTALLREIAAGVRRNHPHARVLLALADQAPEVATGFIHADADPALEVFVSTFDEPPERHTELLQLVEARAQRLVEAGHHVVLLLDSLTGLVRAYNASVPHSGKILGSGLDAHALLRPKTLFSLARQTEEGPSLTVFASLVDDGGMNSVIAAEFEGRANADIVFDEGLIQDHVAPPFDVQRTRTRAEDNVLSGDELTAARRLRASLDTMTNADAIQRLTAPTPPR